MISCKLEQRCMLSWVVCLLTSATQSPIGPALFATMFVFSQFVIGEPPTESEHSYVEG